MPTIEELSIKISSDSKNASSGVDALATSLGKLKSTVKGGAGLTTTTKQIQAFGAAVSSMKNPSTKILNLVNALEPLSRIGKSNLGSALNQLKKIPEVMQGLKSQNLAEFGKQIELVTQYIRPLATEMEKVSNGFSKLPANMQRAINANAKLTTSNRKTRSSYASLGSVLNSFKVKILAVAFAVQRVSTWVSNWVKESNDYVENLNLFTVAMGEYTSEAKAYAEQVQSAFGIDASEFMRYEAVFMNMAKGFGIAADKSYIMSRNMTEMGYDLASLFNVDFDVAMEKLESALSGQPRPMREWGFDLSEATLKAKALEMGITKNVEKMGQHEKAQLRYIQLFETMNRLGITGDLSRTINTSANQLRILKASLTLAARELGNVFIPILNKALPYMIAFLKVVRWIASEIATAFGFTLPEIDYSGIGNAVVGAEDIEDALEGAVDNAKDLKNAMLGIDELNVINKDTGTGTGSTNSNGIDISMPNNENWLSGAIDSQATKVFDEWKENLTPFVKWLQKNFKGLLKTIANIGVAIVAWKVGKGLLTGLGAIGNAFKGISEFWKSNTLKGLTQGFLGAAGLVVGLVTSYNAGRELARVLNGQSGASLGSALGGLVTGGAFGAAGGALVGAKVGSIGGPLGAVIGALLGLAAAMVGVVKENDKIRKELATDTFWSSGAVKVSDLTNAYMNNNESLEALATTTQNSKKTIEKCAVQIGNAGKDIDPYLNKIKATKTVTADTVNAIKGYVKSLAENLKLKLNTEIKVVLSSLDSYLTQIGKKFDATVAKLTDSMLEFEGTFGSAVDRYTAQINALLAKAGTSKGLSKSEAKNLKDAINRLRELEAAKVTPETAAFKNTVTDLKNKAKNGGINAGDTAEATTLLKSFADKANAYKQTLDDSFSASLASIESFKAKARVMYDQELINKAEYKKYMADFAESEKVLRANYDAAVSKYKNDTNDVVAAIGKGAMESMKSVYEKYLGTNLNNKGIGDDSLKSDMLFELKDTIAPIANALAKISVDGVETDWIYNVAQKTIAELFTRSTNGGAAGDWFITGTSNDGTTKKRKATLADFEAALKKAFARAGVPGYASGGFPATGQLFMAREAGAEMVGSIGNKTAVVNNDQIVEAVSRGVYEAVSSAQSQQGGDRAVYVYLDGKQIEASVRTTQQRRGVAIGTGGILNYV